MAKNKNIRSEFSSVADFAEYVRDNHLVNTYWINGGDKDFNGEAVAEAVEHGINGDPARAAAIFEAVASVKGAGGDETTVYTRDVQGEFFDVGDVLAGVPEAWYAQTTETTNKSVDIYFNASVSLKIDHEQINRRGAVLVSLIDALSKGGYIPNVYLVFVGKLENRAKTPFAVKIAVDNKPLDIDAIAFVACNPAALRRLGLMWLEMLSKKPYQNAYVTDDYYFDDLAARAENATVIFPGFRRDGEYKSDERGAQVLAYILRELENGETVVKAAC